MGLKACKRAARLGWWVSLATLGQLPPIATEQPEVQQHVTT